MLTIITGVGRAGQVGEALAWHFAARGARLVLLNRDGAAAEAHAAALRDAGHDATAHGVDLTDPARLSSLARRLADDAPDGAAALVHAAGGFAASGPLDAGDPAVLHDQLAVNLVTAYCATRAFLPLLRAGRGAIVYFASAAALPGGAAKGLAAYTAAKAGVLALMRAVAADEAAHGVRANAVAPTTVRTAENEAAMTPSDRWVSREAVAEVVHWLCSPAARDITGQVLRVGR